MFHHRDESDIVGPSSTTTTTTSASSGGSGGARSKRKRLAVCAQSENIIYSNYGQLEEEDVASGNLCNYLVGMLSKDGQSVVLRQVPPIADVRCSVDTFDRGDSEDDSSPKLIGDKVCIWV